MKTEMQTLEQALAEVMATRQRLDGIADQLRTTISALRVEVQLADRAKLAADERAAQAKRLPSVNKRQTRRPQRSVPHSSACCSKLLKPLVDSGVELAWHHCGPKGQTDPQTMADPLDSSNGRRADKGRPNGRKRLRREIL